MKRFILATLVAVSLTACGSVSDKYEAAQSSAASSITVTPTTPSTTSAPRTTAPTTTQAPTVLSVQQQAIAFLRTDTAYFNGNTDEEIIELFYSICDNLDAGGTVESVVQLGVDAAIPRREVLLATGYAIASTCTQYYPQFEEYTGG